MDELLEKLNINPYNYLEVDEMADMETIKKAYRKKAKILHPDKNNGKTETQFKILALCYKYAKKNFINTPVKDFTELKSTEEIEVNTHRGFYDTNFDDTDTRRQIFADDDINFEEFQKQVDRIKNLPTSYSAENFYKKEILDKMKTKGKFDKEKFNAYFSKLKNEGKICKELVKVDKIQASNEHHQYMKVNMYEDMIINLDEGKGDGNYSKLMESHVLTQKDIDDLLQSTEVNEIKALINKNKKDTGKISRKKFKEIQNKKSLPIAVDKQKSFSELERELEILNWQKIKEEKEQQKNNVKKYKHVYDKTIKFVD